ncbi:hypothetical protein DFO70_101478 [Cytobacillus firmus]|uniref:Uncharacterized protein n=2 Tax=Cytobacillus TaxID=2675230 RepID=A0A366K5U9_CYTFI|nr:MULTISPECIES: hypothetical protein [Cytobacillus]RBP96662.1 hypothetical protein DFO70_101478 [Cytobacillus firmus]TDX45611.1 hypothetical protein DFO72_10279 [Cytobacillus oceanisediminis]
MTTSEIKKLRIRQLLFLNGNLLFFLTATYILQSFIDITFSQMFIFLGMITLIQSILGWAKRNSTKSIFPVIEKVAIYEKEKMGNEWSKQRTVGSIWTLLVSSILFFNAYFHFDSGEILSIEPVFLFFLTIAILVLTNISMVIHSRKVDGAQSLADFKGYTRNSNVRAIIFGVCYVFLIFVLILSLV